MSAMEEVVRLRERAFTLRSLAARIEVTPAMTLDAGAGDDTWRGPAPELCERVLAANQRQLRTATDELRRRGRLLDSRATEIEALAAASAIGVR